MEHCYEAVTKIYYLSPKRHEKYGSEKYILLLFVKKKEKEGFPGGTVVENLPANAGDTGLSPGVGRSHMLRSN